MSVCFVYSSPRSLFFYLCTSTRTPLGPWPATPKKVSAIIFVVQTQQTSPMSNFWKVPHSWLSGAQVPYSSQREAVEFASPVDSFTWPSPCNICDAGWMFGFYLAVDLVFATGSPNWCKVLMYDQVCTTQYDPIMFSPKEWDALTLQTLLIPAREHWWGWAVQVIRWGPDPKNNVDTWSYSGPQFF